MAEPNVSTEERLRLTYNGAMEITELVLAIRGHAKQIDDGLEGLTHEVALCALVDRVEVIANALLDVGMPQEDEHHDVAELRRALRGLRKSTDEAANG